MFFHGYYLLPLKKPAFLRKHLILQMYSSNPSHFIFSDSSPHINWIAIPCISITNDGNIYRLSYIFCVSYHFCHSEQTYVSKSSFCGSTTTCHIHCLKSHFFCDFGMERIQYKWGYNQFIFFQ